MLWLPHAWSQDAAGQGFSALAIRQHQKRGSPYAGSQNPTPAVPIRHTWGRAHEAAFKVCLQ